jgi:hypothetical protein
VTTGKLDVLKLKPLYDNLERYAGWLDREHTSAMVRANVQVLGAAINASTDPSRALQALDVDLARLPSGELRKMLRTAVAKIRRAIAEQP